MVSPTRAIEAGFDIVTPFALIALFAVMMSSDLGPNASMRV